MVAVAKGIPDSQNQSQFLRISLYPFPQELESTFVRRSKEHVKFKTRIKRAVMYKGLSKGNRDSLDQRRFVEETSVEEVGALPS